MTDWTVVGTATLWTLGLAIILATLSYARQRAREGGVRLRAVLSAPGYLAAIDAGLALVYAGLFFNARSIWGHIAWLVLATLSVVLAFSGLRWMARVKREE